MFVFALGESTLPAPSPLAILIAESHTYVVSSSKRCEADEDENAPYAIATLYSRKSRPSLEWLCSCDWPANPLRKKKKKTLRKWIEMKTLLNSL